MVAGRNGEARMARGGECTVVYRSLPLHAAGVFGRGGEGRVLAEGILHDFVSVAWGWDGRWRWREGGRGMGARAGLSGAVRCADEGTGGPVLDGEKGGGVGMGFCARGIWGWEAVGGGTLVGLQMWGEHGERRVCRYTKARPTRCIRCLSYGRRPLPLQRCRDDEHQWPPREALA